MNSKFGKMILFINFYALVSISESLKSEFKCIPQINSQMNLKFEFSKLKKKTFLMIQSKLNHQLIEIRMMMKFLLSKKSKSFEISKVFKIHFKAKTFKF